MDDGASPLLNRFMRAAAVAVTAALFAVTVPLQMNIDAERSKLGLETTAAELTASTVLKFLGGLRSAAAAYLWLKVDRIHDEFYGEILEKEHELAPLYRMVTWLDPHLVDAYYVGSFMLYKFKRPKEGWKFAQEGLRVNPNSWKMELNVGQLALFYRNDPRTAIPHLRRAVALAEDDEGRLLSMGSLEAALRKAGSKNEADKIKKMIEDLRSKVQVTPLQSSHP